ncbi:MAG TPA: hypothetical protein VN882_04310 [Steroidobacteraceae bacterium]|nr:hypothetical protein [Steroidobacteraceae bacterium]
MSAAPPSRSAPLTRLSLVLLVGTGLAVAIAYAQPTADNDLFWHLAYARQMLDRGTLIPDAALYSWTPTSGSFIYCAWLGELALYLVWSLAGLAGLFALRYLVVFGAGALLFGYARRRGVAGSALTGLAILITLLGGQAGTLLKPELFSFLLFQVLVLLILRGREAARAGDGGARLFAWIPLLFVVWANTHGAFAIGGGLVLAALIGELLNARFSPGLALPSRALRWLLASGAACAVAVCLTPYGIAYPRQLLTDDVFGALARPDVGWNSAMHPIFAGDWLGSPPVTYLAVGLAALAALAIRMRKAPPGARCDWTLILAHAFYLPWYIVHLRTTYFWATLVGWTLIEWQGAAAMTGTGASPAATQRKGPWVAACVTAWAGLGGRALELAVHEPQPYQWLGFGIGYAAPVAEAEYVAQLHFGSRLYNIFDSGGYLLWRLYPQYRVMVDSRSFPYLSWFADQYRFTSGADHAGFLARYPADVAVIDLAKHDAWGEFMRDAGWRLAYYGPTAAVFVPADHTRDLPATPADPARFDSLRNARVALAVFDFATFVGDFSVAWRTLDHIERDLAGQADPARLLLAREYRLAYGAMRDHQYAAALDHLKRALADRRIDRARETHPSPRPPVCDRDRILLTFLLAMQRLEQSGRTDEAGPIVTSIDQLAAGRAAL